MSGVANIVDKRLAIFSIIVEWVRIHTHIAINVE